MAVSMIFMCVVFLIYQTSQCSGVETNYIVGAGISDITGPAAEVDMMGYANPAQTSKGIHLRQYSRAFVIADAENKTRVVFVSTDSCMQSQGLKLEHLEGGGAYCFAAVCQLVYQLVGGPVTNSFYSLPLQQIVKRLKAKYGNLYTERNVAISGTHTHSGPGGFHQYLLYDITSLGFVNETFLALVDGIVKSIDEAHTSMRPANIYMKTGELLESNINRSPTAYMNNPAEERAKYEHNTDKNMTLLKIVDENNNGIGMINWFAVHCTSMNNTNHLISSDNKGYASQLFEFDMNNNAFPGEGKFVAAFAQSNLGDVSPNTKGPHCLDTGKSCDNPSSTCNGRNEMCVAFGPGKDMFESTKIIAENQYRKAKELYSSASIKLSGPIDFRHSYVDMSNVEVINAKNATTKDGRMKTCLPAMGYSFAAGTTDGPGAFDFKQGATTGNPFWDFIRDFLKTPSKEQTDCQNPKPILLDTGEISAPYMWSPTIVDVQLLRVGQLAIIAAPAEFSTMSGRRTRDNITATLIANGLPEGTTSVIAGLTNDYADYVTTYEEYQVQRYEGASTIFGPHTLEAYIQEFSALAKAIAKGESVPAGPNPPNLLDRQVSFLPPVVFDRAPIGENFGSVITDANSQYVQGESVAIKFVGANPRNDKKLGSTFLTVEMSQGDGQWKVVYKDSQWETKFAWKASSMLTGTSEVTITWDIPPQQTPGTYRIQYFGNSKDLFGNIKDFSGKSSEFKVITHKQAVKNKLYAKSKENSIIKNNYFRYSPFLSKKSKDRLSRKNAIY